VVVTVLVGVLLSEFGSKLFPVALNVFIVLGTAAASGITTIVSTSLAPAASRGIVPMMVPPAPFAPVPVRF
jgi:hypothetical protein